MIARRRLPSVWGYGEVANLPCLVRKSKSRAEELPSRGAMQVTVGSVLGATAGRPLPRGQPGDRRSPLPQIRCQPMKVMDRQWYSRSDDRVTRAVRRSKL